MPESGSSGHVLLVLHWASQLFRDYFKSGSSTEDDLSLQIVTNPHPELFFKAVIVSVLERRSAPHDQRRVAASAYGSLTLVISLS